MQDRPRVNDPREVLREAGRRGMPVLVAGPMVRYSKLPFRETVRELGRRFRPQQLIIVYTPMILAREFVRNSVARMGDFTTSDSDSPLIIQFGASNPVDLARAAVMVQPHCDGIGLNCGCPIPEQCREGIGAALMTQPHRVAAMIRAVKKACPGFYVEAKIRVHSDLNTTVRFARIVETAGADAICVHGRRKADRSGNVPVNLEAIALVKKSVKCPVIANGDFRVPKDLERIYSQTGVDGIMSARGVLNNPALFCGPQFTTCPWSAIELFWDFAMASGLPYQLILHHFVEMFKGRGDLAKLRRELVTNSTTVALIDWFDARFDLKRKDETGFGERIEWPLIDEANTA